ncbi:hypothetical protein ACJRO7_020498 [Eucalyptus globulus]|uniref:Uncharacterized protein n=1 Tax=Eucalyptus globulus TaxID=34317 RepID=A0ABD3KIS8_EUCGL
MASLKITPVLFYLGKLYGETIHGFLNPITSHLTLVQISELECQVDRLASKHGWLLLLSRKISTGTFTTAPNSSNCTIFIVNFESIWQAVYAKGIFYCVDLKGRVGTFNIKDVTWNVIPCKDKSVKVWKLLLLELNEEIFAAKRARHGIVQEFFKLKVGEDLSEWEKGDVAIDVTYYLGDWAIVVRW